MFEGIMARIFGPKPAPPPVKDENAAASDEKAVANPAAIAPPVVAKPVANPVANPAANPAANPEDDAGVKAKVHPPLSSEASVVNDGQKGGSRRRRRRSCGKSKKGGGFSGMGFGRVGGKSHRRRHSKKRNTHKRRK
jgi:hypothetical protein